MMRFLIEAGLALTHLHLTLASATVFSVHDDLLAFPQYDVVFSEDLIADSEVERILANPSPSADDASPSLALNIANHLWDPSTETYELMWLRGAQYLCTIPIVEATGRNETSEAEARVAEQKELARATESGWELLQELDGKCLYFVSGWWSYAFCYNAEITQFHPLPPQPGPAMPPQPDPSVKGFVLGKAKASPPTREDEWGNQIEVHKARKDGEPPLTELQVKGDTRYMVQKMEGGTICDLTGKPRRVEVQFHCNPSVQDRIAYIKEVTTCSYLMVVYTPRLCNDVAFMPPKETKANRIVCQPVVPVNDLQVRNQNVDEESKVTTTTEETNTPLNVGGIIVGGGKFIGKEGQRLPIPTNFGREAERTSQIIARAKSKADGGQVEMASEAKLLQLDLEPKVVDALRKEVEKMAKDKGWKIEVVDEPGQIREIVGIVDGDDELEEVEEAEEGDEEGSEEIYKDEL